MPVGSGLHGTELRIDCTVSDGHRCPAHVVTYAEARFTLISATDHAEAVGQLWVSVLAQKWRHTVQQLTLLQNLATNVTSHMCSFSLLDAR